MIMSEDLGKKLRQVLESSKGWAVTKTTVEGLGTIKLPATATRPASLAVEINPIVGGKPSKRRGLILTSHNQYELFKEIINNPKVGELLVAIDAIKEKAKEKEVLEI